MKKLIIFSLAAALLAGGCKDKNDPAPNNNNNNTGCRLSTVRDTGPGAMTYTANYDSQGRLTGLQSPMLLFGTTVSYNSAGKVSRAEYTQSNGVRLAITYNYSGNNLGSMGINLVDEDLVQTSKTLNIVYGSNGKPDRANMSPAEPSNGFVKFTYDGEKLTKAEYYENSQLQSSSSLIYDAAGQPSSASMTRGSEMEMVTFMQMATASDASNQANGLIKMFLPSIVFTNLLNGLPSQVIGSARGGCGGSGTAMANTYQEDYIYVLDSRGNPANVSVRHKDLCSNKIINTTNAATFSWQCP